MRYKSSISQESREEVTHRYGANTFKLHRLPPPRPGQVLGLVGKTREKSTALKVLAGKLKPNLGQFATPPEWGEILTYFRGSELQNYFTKVLEDKIKAVLKPQYVDHIPRAVKGKVGDILTSKDERGKLEELMVDLDLTHLPDRDVDMLSGGELQRFAIGVVATQKAQTYMFDEPSSYLDVRQRMKTAGIRSLLEDEMAYVITVEHDLAVLDYL